MNGKKNQFRGLRIARYVVYRETLVDKKELFWSFIGSITGISLLAYLNYKILPDDAPLLIGSFGATAVLLYGAIQSPLAQPRNLIGGHLFSAIVGVSMQMVLGHIPWLAAALAVSLSIVVMHITKTLHPPGGATALIATTGSSNLKALGFTYVIFPVLTGALLLLIVALIFNNITKKRRYPVQTHRFKFLYNWPNHFKKC